MILLAFASLYVGFGISSESHDLIDALLVNFGVFIGSVAWWLILAFVSSLFRNKINLHASRQLNRISGGVIFICGLVALLFSLSLP